jgi:hypothetical protein
VDFITHLPLSNGYDAILVIIDRLTKIRHYVPYYMTDNAEDVSRIFIREIYRLYGALVSVISDRDIRFINEFLSRFMDNHRLLRRCLRHHHVTTAPFRMLGVHRLDHLQTDPYDPLR